MWVKFEAISSDNDIICFPYSRPESTSRIETAVFGRRGPVSVNVIYSGDHESDADNTFENPAAIRISTHLCEHLLLPTSPVYQMKIDGSGIIIGPVIGLLLGIHSHRYNPKHMMKYSDRMGIYSQIGGLIYAFSPKTVNWEKHQAFGLFYNIASEEWEYGCFPLPDVIYRRDFHSNPKYIKRLTEITGGRLFNSYRFTKMELYDYLIAQNEIKEYLPPTELSLSYKQAAEFIDRHGKVILKPLDLSRGRGICIIEKINTFYRITDYRYKNPAVSTLKSPSDLEQFFKLNRSFFHKYLIQKYLNLARIGSSVFDIRVVMQKNKGRLWGCTGIECRVSNKSHLTNISRGGYALTLREALEKAFAKDYEPIADKIDRFCLDICSRMDRMGHHFAEFGLDIAVDVNKAIWLIEANVFPSFKGFKKMNRNTYLAIRYMPLFYALSLTEFGN